jgi:hypothetical protein
MRLWFDSFFPYNEQIKKWAVRILLLSLLTAALIHLFGCTCSPEPLMPDH